MSVEIFTPESLSIEQVFGNTDSFYQIPDYQRPYSWDKERVEQLWYDIVEAYKNNLENPEQDTNYFLGSLVVVKNRQGGYDVIDGQQRMTTLTILFCVFRDIEGLNLEEDFKDDIEQSIQKRDKKRLKLTTHLNNQALFETSIINGINFSANKKELENNRFLQTAFYFKELIDRSMNNASDEYIGNFSEFVKYLFEKTKLIRVSCDSESFAIKLFTILNDRGLDLTSADIIKAYLLQNLDDNKHSTFIEVWKEVEGICKQSSESLQMVLNLYLYYLKASNPKKNLHDELKKELNIRDQKEIISSILSIKTFAQNLMEINNNYEDKDISKLKYLPQSIYWKTILLTANQENYPFYNELKGLLVKYYYQSWIADGTSNRIKQTSFNIIRSIKEKKDIGYIKKQIIDNLGEYENYIDSLDRKNVYF